MLNVLNALLESPVIGLRKEAAWGVSNILVSNEEIMAIVLHNKNLIQKIQYQSVFDDMNVIFLQK